MRRQAPYKVEWERALLRDGCLPLPAIAVGMAMASYANPDGTRSRVGQARLARDLGTSDRTVRKWQKVLASAGWLKLREPEESGHHFLIPDRSERSGDESGEGRNVRADDRTDPSAATGTSAPLNRNERSAYQHKTNSSTNTKTKPTDHSTAEKGGSPMTDDEWMDLVSEVEQEQGDIAKTGNTSSSSSFAGESTPPATRYQGKTARYAENAMKREAREEGYDHVTGEYGLDPITGEFQSSGRTGRARYTRRSA